MNNKLTVIASSAGPARTPLTPAEMNHTRDSIVALHENNVRISQLQGVYQFAIGYELLRVRESIQHNAWETWVEENLSKIPKPISLRTSQLYMQFAKGLIAEAKTVADLTRKPLLLTNGEVPKEAEAVILEAVHEFADGRSFREMLRALNILREPKKQEYTAPKELSAEEKAKAEEDQAHDLIQDAIVALRLTLDDKTKADSKRPDRKELIDICIEVSKAYKALNKRAGARSTSSGMQRHSRQKKGSK